MTIMNKANNNARPRNMKRIKVPPGTHPLPDVGLLPPGCWMGMRQAIAARRQSDEPLQRNSGGSFETLSFQSSTVWSKTLSEDYRRTLIPGPTGIGNMPFQKRSR